MRIEKLCLIKTKDDIENINGQDYQKYSLGDLYVFYYPEENKKYGYAVKTNSNRIYETIEQIVRENDIPYKKGDSIEELLKYLEEKGFIHQYVSPDHDKEISELEEEYRKAYNNYKNESPDLVPYVEPGTVVVDTQEEEEKKNPWIKVLAGVLATGAIVGGGLAIFHSCSQDKSEEDQSQKSIYDKLTAKQKAFFDKTNSFLTKFNNLTTQKDNFYLEIDGNKKLSMSYAEAIALNISINDYTQEEIFEIFGILGLDAENITALRDSAYEKLVAYYMNAKEATGLSSMIVNEDARAFYDSQEQAIIAFNANPNTTTSKEFIQTTYANYLAVKDGGTISMKESLKAGESTSAITKAAYMASSMTVAYMNANRNMPEYLRDGNLVLTSQKSNEDNQTTEIGIIDIINYSNLCKVSNESINSLINDYNNKVNNILANEQNILLNSLTNEAQDILKSQGYTEQSLQQAAQISANDSSAVNRYRQSLEQYGEKGELVQAYIEDQSKNIVSTTKEDVAALINNRFRNSIPKKTDAINPDGTITEEGKETATVVGESTTRTEEKVDYEDLTDAEKEMVAKQKQQAIEEEAKIFAETQGKKDASEAATEEGYKYNGEALVDANGDRVEPRTFYEAAYQVAANTEGVYEESITPTAEEHQNFLEGLEEIGIDINSDTSKYTDIYNQAYITTIDEISDKATKEGKEVRERIQKELAALEEAIEKANNELSNGNQTDGESIIPDTGIGGISYNDSNNNQDTATPTTPEQPIDPEIDQDYNQGGVPINSNDSIDMGVYFDGIQKVKH